MKELNLPLERKWYEMTDVNGKTEEYRKINIFWGKRLLDNFDYRWRVLTGHYHTDDINRKFHLELAHKTGDKIKGFKQFDINVMTLGYPKKNDPLRTKKYKHLGIEIGYGRQDWGAPADELVFIIKHGEEVGL